MRKKYLSALLFGALLFASAGTFTSCKDYDDDIENLQDQISANASAIEALKKVVESGDYVTGVEKSADGLTITFKNAGAKTITLEDKVGSVVTINEDGYLCIDGKATDIKAATTTEAKKDQIIIENGVWSVLQEEGTYKSTGIPVSGVTVTGTKKDGYTLSIYNENGEKTSVELPTAASLITSIELMGDGNSRILTMQHATFIHPGNAWKGKATLPDDKSEIYVGNSLNVRINPVDAPAIDAEYTLTDVANRNLPYVILTPSYTDVDGNASIGTINGRGTYKGNGLYTLNMKKFVLSALEQEDVNFIGATDGTISNVNNAKAWAINANSTARSAYAVAACYKSADDLSQIQINGYGNDSKATLVASGSAPTATRVTLKVGTTYKIIGTGNDELLLDTYFSVSDRDKTTFDIEYDDLNRTFKIGKNPDDQTSPSPISLTVYTLDIKGSIKKAEYKITLSSEVSSAVTYDAVTYNIANLYDNNGNNDAINVAIDQFKTANAANWSKIINSVDLSQTSYGLYSNASCPSWALVNSDVSTTLAPAYKKGSNTTTEMADLTNIVLSIKKENNDNITLDTQYYLKIQFKTSRPNSSNVASLIIPVTFTAPSVADQFKASAGFLDNDGNVVAYYNRTVDTKPQLMTGWFDAYDAAAAINLKTDDKVVTKNSTDYSSSALAIFCEGVRDFDEQTDPKMENSFLYLRRGATGELLNGDGTEFGYNQVLTVEAKNTNFKDSGWKYPARSTKTSTSFTIRVASPIYEGSVVYKTGNKISVKANGENGALITADMIWLKDYANNKYTIIPDQLASSDAPNTAGTIIRTDDKDRWSAAQISKVAIDYAGNNYIENVKIQLPKEADTTAGTEAVPGAFVVYANSLSQTTTTKVKFKVTDRWGYTQSFEVELEIVVE